MQSLKHWVLAALLWLTVAPVLAVDVTPQTPLIFADAFGVQVLDDPGGQLNAAQALAR